jgi:hypothetical protein
MADDPTDDKPEGKPDDPEVFNRPEDAAGKKALEQERTARREAEKANADLAKRLKEFEDADKSELEKATTAAAEAAKRAEEAELKALRLEVAGDKGLTPSQARRLVGSTKEELEADADQLLEDFAANAKPAPKVPPRPKPPAGSKDKGDPGELEGKERAAAALRDMRNTR